MEILSKEDVASVGLVEVRISGDELAVLEAALSYFLDTFGKEIHRRLGAKRDEVEGIRDDVREAMRARSEVKPIAEMAEKS
jgi:hypothetical protein